MFNLVKKSMAVLLCLAMVFALTACNNNGKEGAASNNKGTGEAFKGNVNITEYDFDSEAFLKSMPDNLKGTTIKFLNWYDPMQREEGAVIKAFEQKTGCKVEVIVKAYGDEYNESLASFVATGNSPDVIRMKEPSVAMLKSLQPIKNTGYDFSAKGWDEDAKNNYSVNGVQYGANLKFSPFFLPAMVFYNTKVFKELGLEDPYTLWKNDQWTWDKLTQMCTDWVGLKDGNTGLAMLPLGDVPAMTKGIDWAKYDGKQYTVNLADKSMIDAWTYTLENKKNRVFCESQDGFDKAEPTTLFAAMDATAVQTSSQYYSKTRKRGNLGVVPYPTWTNKADYYVPMIEDLAFGVPMGAKNAKAVPYFLAYYLDFSNYNTDGTNFFFSEQAKECYIDLLCMPKRFAKTSFAYAAEGGYNGVMIFRNVDPAQLVPHLQEREYIINDKVAQTNAALKKLDGQKK